MQTATTSVGALKKLMKLARSKDKLQNQLEEVNNEMAGLLKELSFGSLVSPTKPATSKSSVTTTATKPKRRGNLTDGIVTALKAAGPEGAKVPHIAKQVGTKGGNVHAWIASTGKSLIERVGRGRYRLKQQQDQEQEHQH